MTSLFPYSLKKPDDALPLIFDSPHSGRDYPKDFTHICRQEDMIRAEDNHIDVIFESAPFYGAALLCAHFPRTYIDVNRALDDIDPALLQEAELADIKPSARSHAGIGLIRRLLEPEKPLYNKTLTLEEIQNRIERYYIPYHNALNEVLENAYYQFGTAYYINCHSMPSEKQKYRYQTRPYKEGALADFCLGDRNGTSCSLDFTHSIRDFLSSLGYSVSINHPYKGVELVRRYSAPSEGKHAMQLEINKSLYWDEENGCFNKNAPKLKADMEKFIHFCAQYVSSNIISQAAD